jgi:hypothetical protein
MPLVDDWEDHVVGDILEGMPTARISVEGVVEIVHEDRHLDFTLCCMACSHLASNPVGWCMSIQSLEMSNRLITVVCRLSGAVVGSLRKRLDKICHKVGKS